MQRKEKQIIHFFGGDVGGEEAGVKAGKQKSVGSILDICV